MTFQFDEKSGDKAPTFFERCLTHTKGDFGQPLLVDDVIR